MLGPWAVRDESSCAKCIPDPTQDSKYIEKHLLLCSLMSCPVSGSKFKSTVLSSCVILAKYDRYAE